MWSRHIGLLLPSEKWANQAFYNHHHHHQRISVALIFLHFFPSLRIQLLHDLHLSFSALEHCTRRLWHWFQTAAKKKHGTSTVEGEKCDSMAIKNSLYTFCHCILFVSRSLHIAIRALEIGQMCWGRKEYQSQLYAHTFSVRMCVCV